MMTSIQPTFGMAWRGDPVRHGKPLRAWIGAAHCYPDMDDSNFWLTLSEQEILEKRTMTAWLNDGQRYPVEASAANQCTFLDETKVSARKNTLKAMINQGEFRIKKTWRQRLFYRG